MNFLELVAIYNLRQPYSIFKNYMFSFGVSYTGFMLMSLLPQPGVPSVEGVLLREIQNELC